MTGIPLAAGVLRCRWMRAASFACLESIEASKTYGHELSAI